MNMNICSWRIGRQAAKIRRLMNQWRAPAAAARPFIDIRNSGARALEGRQPIAGGEPRSGAAPGEDGMPMSPGWGDRRKTGSFVLPPFQGSESTRCQPRVSRGTARPGAIVFGPRSLGNFACQAPFAIVLSFSTMMSTYWLTRYFDKPVVRVMKSTSCICS
jgi:hypothetical protein